MHPKILVVDTYASNRMIYRDWLSEIDGVEIMEATAAEHALRLARAHEFAVILIDINLHGLDGFDLARRLAADAPHGAAPMILVTSELTEASHLLRGYQAGATDIILAAPAHGETVLEKVRPFVERFRRQDSLNRYVGELRGRVVTLARQVERLRE